MLARSFDAVVGSTCVSKSSGPVLISGDDTIASCSICLSTPSCCCSGKSGATTHSLGLPGDTGTIALEHGLSIGCIGSASRSSGSPPSCLSDCKVFKSDLNVV